MRGARAIALLGAPSRRASRPRAEASLGRRAVRARPAGCVVGWATCRARQAERWASVWGSQMSGPCLLGREVRVGVVRRGDWSAPHEWSARMPRPPLMVSHVPYRLHHSPIPCPSVYSPDSIPSRREMSVPGRVSPRVNPRRDSCCLGCSAAALCLLCPLPCRTRRASRRRRVIPGLWAGAAWRRGTAGRGTAARRRRAGGRGGHLVRACQGRA